VFLTTYRAKASFATMGVTDSLKKLYESEMTGANRESTMVSCPLPSNAAVDRDGRFARTTFPPRLSCLDTLELNTTPSPLPCRTSSAPPDSSLVPSSS
jgi:hypothetical protein